MQDRQFDRSDSGQRLFDVRARNDSDVNAKRRQQLAAAWGCAGERDGMERPFV
jgi:hypothetical protein